MGKANEWQTYELINIDGNGFVNNTKIYTLVSQEELFESYLLISQEVLITGIIWRNQGDTYFSGYTCYSPSNQCCFQASKLLLNNLE